MIDIAKLRKEDIGKWVLYIPSYGKTEKGRLKSWNEKWIFIVYNCDGEWYKFQDYTGAATNPDNLRFTTAEEVISVRRNGSGKLSVKDVPPPQEANLI